MTILPDAQPPITGKLLSRCAAVKTRAAWEFIAALPGIVEPWTMRERPKRKARLSHDAKTIAEEGAEGHKDGTVGEAGDLRSPSGKPTLEISDFLEDAEAAAEANEAADRQGGKRRAAVFTLTDANAESAEDARRRDDEAYFPERNRLQCSLTPAVIRDICTRIADAAIAVNPPWNVRVASVEAAETSAALAFKPCHALV